MLMLHPSSMDWHMERHTLVAPESFVRLTFLAIRFSPEHVNQLNALLGLLAPPRFPKLRELCIWNTSGRWDGNALMQVRIPLRRLEIKGSSIPSEKYNAITSLQSLTSL